MMPVTPESRSVALALAQRFVDYKDKIEEIAQQLRRYQKVLDLCPLPMFLSDEHGKCVYVNPAKLRITGGTLEDMQIDGWQRFVHPEDLTPLRTAWLNYIRDDNKVIFTHKHRYQCPGGTYVSVFVEARMMEDKTVVGFVLPAQCKACLPYFSAFHESANCAPVS